MLKFKMFDFVHLVIVIFISLSLIQTSKNASLNLQDQKKYQSFIEGLGLYSPEDDVEILTVENFKNKLYSKNHAWVIEFYSSWCGFCQRFAPSWKALGTDIKGWSNLIKVGAIDCSNDDNTPICRDFEIMSYPTVLYFHENYQEGPTNLGLKVEKGRDMEGHKYHLLETIISEQDNGRAVGFPNLHPATFGSTSELSESVASKEQYIFLIIHDVGSYVGPEIMLDFHDVDKITIKYALNNNTELLSNLDLKAENLPAVVILENSSSFILGKKYTNKLEIEEAMRNYLKLKNILIPETEVKDDIFRGDWIDAEVPDMSAVIQARERYALMQKVKQMGDVVFQMDLETALRYSLKHEVTGTSEVSSEKLEALKNYLRVLAKYFPLGNRGQAFLTEIKNLVEDSDSTFETSKIHDLLLEAEKEENQVFSSHPHWLGCKGSSDKFRGYPCGLWKMFHYLTVNAAEWNIEPNSGNSQEILDAMYGYIKYFFGCADCSQHFQSMADRRHIKNVTTYDSSILWLWAAHNEVNERLAGDETEDPEYPKYRFPSKDRCPQCRNSDDTWDQREVLKYIKHMYSSINIRYIGSDTRIIHMGLEGPTTSSGATSIFRTIDTTRVPEKDVHVRPDGESLILDESS